MEVIDVKALSGPQLAALAKAGVISFGSSVSDSAGNGKSASKVKAPTAAATKKAAAAEEKKEVPMPVIVAMSKELSRSVASSDGSDAFYPVHFLTKKSPSGQLYLTVLEGIGGMKKPPEEGNYYGHIQRVKSEFGIKDLTEFASRLKIAHDKGEAAKALAFVLTDADPEKNVNLVLRWNSFDGDKPFWELARVIGGQVRVDTFKGGKKIPIYVGGQTIARRYTTKGGKVGATAKTLRLAHNKAELDAIAKEAQKVSTLGLVKYSDICQQYWNTIKEVQSTTSRREAPAHRA